MADLGVFGPDVVLVSEKVFRIFRDQGMEFGFSGFQALKHSVLCVVFGLDGFEYLFHGSRIIRLAKMFLDVLDVIFPKEKTEFHSEKDYSPLVKEADCLFA